MKDLNDMEKIEKPREKLLRYGPGKLRDFELLAAMLGTGTRNESVLSLSRRILRNFPGGGLAGAGVEQLKKIPGIGTAKACEIAACFELGRRFLKGKKREIFLKPAQVWEELRDIRNSRKEHFVILYLDSKNQEMEREIISVGALNYNVVHPREVFEPAVKKLAASIIVAHNHPSGNLEPSREDLSLTERLVKAGEILGIEILDHVIVCSGGYLSFKERGLIKP